MIIEFNDDDLPWSDERIAEVQDQIDSAREYNQRLRRRDREFLDSIEQYLRDRRRLTEKQLTWLSSLID